MTAKKKGPHLPDGRPSEYTVEKGDYICKMVASHPVGYKKLRQQYKDLPDDTTINCWREKYPEFSRRYRLAKLQQTEVMIHSLEDLADDVNMYIDDKGNQRVDTGSVAQQKLRADNRKWLASKLIPKVYGDASHVEELKDENEELRKEALELRAKLAEKHKKDY